MPSVNFRNLKLKDNNTISSPIYLNFEKTYDKSDHNQNRLYVHRPGISC